MSPSSPVHSPHSTRRVEWGEWTKEENLLPSVRGVSLETPPDVRAWQARLSTTIQIFVEISGPGRREKILDIFERIVNDVSAEKISPLGELILKELTYATWKGMTILEKAWALAAWKEDRKKHAVLPKQI